MKQLSRTSIVLLVVLAITVPTRGQPGPGRGRDERHQQDHEVFHFLLTNHKKIKRTVKEIPGGVETLTESDDPKVAEKIKEHVRWMEYRVEKVNPIRMRDPLFAELFRNAHKITIERKETKKGVKVVETSKDPFVVKLIRAHARVVSGFVERGFGEAMKSHAVPTREETEEPAFVNPVIENYGKVVKLPTAAQQPRENTKIVVDITKGSKPGELNPAIEKVARFVNIYQGAGAKPAKVSLAVVLHGDATLAVLNAEAYAKRFGVKENPNFECLHQLHEAGVRFYVCGQSLVGKGAKPDEVIVFVDVAVSALTSLANLQADGHAYVPLAN